MDRAPVYSGSDVATTLKDWITSEVTQSSGTALFRRFLESLKSISHTTLYFVRRSGNLPLLCGLNFFYESTR